MQTVEMLERSSRLREDAGMYERRDRAKIRLRKGGFEPTPRGVVMEGEMEVLGAREHGDGGGG